MLKVFHEEIKKHLNADLYVGELVWNLDLIDYID